MTIDVSVTLFLPSLMTTYAKYKNVAEKKEKSVMVVEKRQYLLSVIVHY